MKFKKLNKLLAALVVSSLVSVSAVKGAPINGDIHFKNGSADLDAPGASATQITNIVGVETNAAVSTGNYASVADGTSVTIADLDFTSVGWSGNVSITDFWTFTDGGVDYAFHLESVTGSTWENNTLTINGVGDATADGYESARGSFQLSSSGTGATISFSSVTEVPDSGTTIALLGLSMLGLAGGARRLGKK